MHTTQQQTSAYITHSAMTLTKPEIHALCCGAVSHNRYPIDMHILLYQRGHGTGKSVLYLQTLSKGGGRGGREVEASRIRGEGGGGGGAG